MIREGETFRKAGWDEALDLVAEKFGQIKEQYGPDALAGISCARSINEDSYNMQKLFRAVIGTNNIDHCARTCHAPTVAGLAKAFGSGAMTNSFKDISETKLFFVIGSNMTEAHPVAASYVNQAVRKGARLIVADPRRNGIAEHAHLDMQIKVGSDVALINAMMHVLITEDLYAANMSRRTPPGCDEKDRAGLSAGTSGRDLRDRRRHDPEGGPGNAPVEQDRRGRRRSGRFARKHRPGGKPVARRRQPEPIHQF